MKTRACWPVSCRGVSLATVDIDAYDVAVVGAGPAGAAAAMAAARAGATVVLLDRHDFPRDKACGDGIAPHVLDFLRDELGLSDVDAGYPAIPTLSLTGPSGAVARRPLRDGVRVIPRLVFDARLVQAAIGAGAVLRKATVRRLWTHADRVELDCGVAARAVVGADGASSVVRRHLGQGPNPPGHLAVAMRGYATESEPFEQRIVMYAKRWPAYAWSFPIGDGRRNIGYGEVLRGPQLSRAYLLERLGSLLGDVDLAAATDLRAHHLPLSTHRPVPGRGRILLAGDALSLINPFTGEGIYYAVVSGALAGRAATHGAFATRHYARALSQRLHRHLRHTTIAARLAGTQKMVDAGIKAGAKHQGVFDDFVELGLGDGLLTARLLWRTAAEVVMR